ncbi:MAG: hypothetical protein AAF639_43805 [Chloroflexota bacterium]
MAQTTTTKLDGGDMFPSMTLQLASGGTLAIPEGVTGPSGEGAPDYVILLGYRGKW